MNIILLRVCINNIMLLPLRIYNIYTHNYISYKMGMDKKVLARVWVRLVKYILYQNIENDTHVICHLLH